MFKALVYAYILGGLTFVPLLVAVVIFITVYTSVPVGDADMAKKKRARMATGSVDDEKAKEEEAGQKDSSPSLDLNDRPTHRKGWLTVRRTFEESENDTSYVTLVRAFLDSRSKDPKRSRPKDMWYAVLKQNILYLYEDEEMTECEAAIELSGHDVVIYPEGLLDGELYAKRNAICLRRKTTSSSSLPSITKEMKLQRENAEDNLEQDGGSNKRKEKEQQELPVEHDKQADLATGDSEAFDPETPWFIFVRSNIEMEDWYFSLLHASSHPAPTPTLLPLREVFDPSDMNHLVHTLDDQPDVIPMRWLNALLGRIFFSHYRTQHLETYIIGRLMKKLEKVKRPQFLTDISVTEVSVGNRPPMLSKPMLKELTKEGDASLEVHFQYKGEIRLTIEATAVINLGARFKSYTVKLVLAAVLKELEGNLLIKVKRPPSNRIWYAFTQTPRMVLEVEPIVSDRQITWGMILSTIESKFKEIIQESVVMPNMDDIAFFDSQPYAHRGGIWADASRRDSPRTFVTPAEPNVEVQSTASAPNPSILSEVPGAPTSHSDDPLAVKSTYSSSPGELGSKSMLHDPSDSNRNNTRRKTWFSSMRSDGESELFPDVLSEDNVSRHSRVQTDYNGNTSDEEASRSRSSSRRRSIHSVRSQKSSKTDHSHVDPATSHRSSSRLSYRESDALEAESNAEDSHSNNNPVTPEKKSAIFHAHRPASPPSFFSTLKSKAGDKQALSNTAKEAMRKWGVNWGLKKETTGMASGDDSHENTPSSSSLNAGTSGSANHKPRASYAEVRAAVAERKEKERQTETEGGSNVIEHLHKSDKPTSTLSSDSVQSDNPSIVSSSARLSTPRLTSKKSTPSISHVNTDIDTEPLVAPDAPIHVQPQAKTMTIPGIHARHRGEIQSMGYVAPEPAPPPAPSKIIESKLKNPAIQTVYRFWKSPPTGNRETDSNRSQNNLSTTSEQPGVVGADSRTETMLDSHQTPFEGIERPTPPPPPPRPVPISAVSPPSSFSSTSSASEALKNIVNKDESSRSMNQEPPESPDPPQSTPEVVAAPSPGDVALTGSLNVNVSAIDSTSNVRSRTPPPLPPRRITAVA